MRAGRRFTTWAWVLLGTYFHLAALASVVAWCAGPEGKPRRGGVVPFCMWVLFESVFAVSLLVSIVVEAVLVPSLKRELQRTGGTSAMWNDAAAGPDELKSFSSEERLAAFYTRPVFAMHNCNVAMMVVELLLNRLRFNASHSAFVVLFFGLPYWVFSVYWFRLTGVYFYFFIDHRKPTAWVGVTATMIATQSFFFLGQALSSVLKPAPTASRSARKKDA